MAGDGDGDGDAAWPALGGGDGGSGSGEGGGCKRGCRNFGSSSSLSQSIPRPFDGAGSERSAASSAVLT